MWKRRHHPASAAGGRGACDVIFTGRGRRRSVASQRAVSLSPALRQSGSQQPACFIWLSARVGSRGDGRRSGRLVVGEPAGRRQQPRYPPARPPPTLPPRPVLASAPCPRVAVAVDCPEEGRGAQGASGTAGTGEGEPVPSETRVTPSSSASVEGSLPKLSFSFT